MPLCPTLPTVFMEHMVSCGIGDEGGLFIIFYSSEPSCTEFVNNDSVGTVFKARWASCREFCDYGHLLDPYKNFIRQFYDYFSVCCNLYQVKKGAPRERSPLKVIRVLRN